MKEFKSIKVPVEEACEIRYGDGDPEIWEMIVDSHIIDDYGRWTNTYEAIVLHKPTDKFYSLSWERGATESQWMDCLQSFGLYGDQEHVEFIEVEPFEVTTTEYRAVERTA